MEVTVVEGCISCGLCTEEHPDLFHMDDAGLAEAVGPVPAGLEDQARGRHPPQGLMPGWTMRYRPEDPWGKKKTPLFRRRRKSGVSWERKEIMRVEIPPSNR